MEEEKLAKDINILSKDDTEIDFGMIIKALECCKQKGGKDTCKYCYTCPASVWDFEDGITECNVDLFQKAINLIHRLQGENERLTELAGDKTLRAIVAQNCTLNEENAELQKQAEELKANQVIECHGLLKDCDMVKQAVKDTAKEILEELYHKNYEIDIKVEDYELHEKAIEIVSKAILKALNERMKAVAERYGVEVE